MEKEIILWREIPLIIILLLIASALLIRGVWYILNIIKWFGVPNVTTNEKIIHTLLEEIKLDKNSVFMDLGAWEWTIVQKVQEKNPDTRCIGIEFAPTAFAKAKAKQKENGWNYELLNKNLFSTDISQATHIYCYLMPHLMNRLRKKVSSECKSGTLIYVNAFPVPNLRPIREIEIEKNGKFIKKLFVYKV